MRKLAVVAVVLTAIAGMGYVVQPHSHGPDGSVISSAQIVLEHSGGCRKSSPAGQCCHAGSQPLHCH